MEGTWEDEAGSAGHVERFWRGFVRLSFAILGFESLAAAVYFAVTGGAPHRGALSAVAFASVGVAVAGFLAAPAIAGRPWREGFHMSVAVASGVVLSACAVLDVGIDSPLAYLIPLPVIAAALVLPLRRVALCAAASVLELVVVGLLDPNVTSEAGAIVILASFVVAVGVLSVVASAQRGRLEERQREAYGALARAAATDPLTGCLNHRAFYDRLSTDVDRFDRYGDPVSLLIADVDLFKSYNDAHGHLAGDEALATIGSLLTDGARTSDVVGRIGGDEFAVILPHTSLEVARDVARRLIRSVAARDGLGVSLSIGVASIDRREPTVRRLIRDADACLYRAKASGRARVEAGPARGVVRLSAAGARTDSEQADLELLEERVRQMGRRNVETAALMESMLRVAPVGVRFVDRDCRTLLVNDVFSRDIGVPAGAQVGRLLKDVLPPVLWRQAEPVFEHVLETGRPEVIEEVFDDVTTGAPAVRYWRSTYFPIEIGAEVTGVGVIGVDVTDSHALADAQRGLLQSVVAALASATELRDPYTAGHQERVAILATAIAAELGFDQDLIDNIELAGRIHDVGKLRVPAELLTRPGALSGSEIAMVKEHAKLGADLLEAVDFPAPICRMVLQHHERLDGSGYPSGLRGEQVDTGARIVAVADVVDAMSSRRPYRPALGIDAALAQIEEGRGTLFDEAVVDACIRLYRTGRITPVGAASLRA